MAMPADDSPEGDVIAADCEAALRWNTRYLIEYTVKFESEEPRTNGDKIRAMNDEELAEWLDLHGECNQCAYHPAQCNTDCNEGHLKWLQKEAEEDAG